MPRAHCTDWRGHRFDAGDMTAPDTHSRSGIEATGQVQAQGFLTTLPARRRTENWLCATMDARRWLLWPQPCVCIARLVAAW